MLVLSRKIEEGFRIGDQIEVKVLDVFATDNTGSRKSKVASIGIEAPREISILRKELKETMETNIQAGTAVRALTGTGLAGILKKKRTLNNTTPEDPGRL